MKQPKGTPNKVPKTPKKELNKPKTADKVVLIQISEKPTDGQVWWSLFLGVFILCIWFAGWWFIGSFVAQETWQKALFAVFATAATFIAISKWK
jgi:hypothetical protein